MKIRTGKTEMSLTPLAGRLRRRPHEMAIYKAAPPETAWILPRGDGSPGMPVFIGLQADAENDYAEDLRTSARVANEQLYWRAA